MRTGKVAPVEGGSKDSEIVHGAKFRVEAARIATLFVANSGKSSERQV